MRVIKICEISQVLKIIKGDGVTTALLKRNGIKVITEGDL